MLMGLTVMDAGQIELLGENAATCPPTCAIESAMCLSCISSIAG